ncbi:hypothetical protein Cfor_03572 [Coptotermes formosanus]|uniref:Endonuclease-reverse transcriptase n=1 Tax=Coptotermes formosanus TaxID=36987 RepID=A0A6L2PTQ6_COPFO|nr:hypothetical protein Cfor_03572 [Coptotermes formosanus]
MQLFINRCLWKILQIRWPDTIRNEAVWERTGQKPLERQIKKRKWSWIGHTLRKTPGITEKDALDWNPQGKRKRGQPKKTWRRTVEEEARDQRKRWQEVKALAKNRVYTDHTHSVTSQNTPPVCIIIIITRPDLSSINC